MTSTCNGGLTYSDACQEDRPEAVAVCHVPEPGRPADLWWFGFDCAHAFDIVPAMELRMRQLGEPRLLPEWAEPDWVRSTYRTMPYVKGEVAQLAAQLDRRPFRRAWQTYKRALRRAYRLSRPVLRTYLAVVLILNVVVAAVLWTIGNIIAALVCALGLIAISAIDSRMVAVLGSRGRRGRA